MPAVAESLAEVAEDTGTVVTEKVPCLAPAGIVTVEGTVAETLSDDKKTTKPVACAGLSRVSVPVAVLPPATEAGETVNPVR